MNPAISAMLKAYGPVKNQRDEINALREILQRVTLLGLHRGNFFNLACFYGGTALRLLYDLDRFSEDMDFCLKKPDPSFNFRPYIDAVRDELSRYGLKATFEEKRTGIDVAIESAFVKQDTLSGLMLIGSNSLRAHKGQLLKIRIEVDKTNPPGGKEDKKLIKLPIPFMVGTLTAGSLFAGKVHALLARAYLNRVKGRDYYDFVFFLTRGTKLNLAYLEAKLRDSGHYQNTSPLTLGTVKNLLKERFSTVDFDRAREDIRPFLSQARIRDLEEWSPDLFAALADGLEIE